MERKLKRPLNALENYMIAHQGPDGHVVKLWFEAGAYHAALSCNGKLQACASGPQPVEAFKAVINALVNSGGELDAQAVRH